MGFGHRQDFARRHGARKNRSGLKSVLRMTPNDNREFERPPLMRRGRYWEAMLELFEGSAAASAKLLNIESVGGKELHDEALVNGDLAATIFSLCILGERDMRFLWTHLQKIADKHGVKCAGDTACGFGNTAMVLAQQKMIPRVFAAVVRAVTAVRSLVAYECGDSRSWADTGPAPAGWLASVEADAVGGADAIAGDNRTNGGARRACGRLARWKR
jgi:methanol--5-hydroxybenzimidazolylcobamide Co-methyltransferase